MIGYTDRDKLQSGELRRVLTTLIERIELEAPKTAESALNFTIRYRLPITGVKLASPRGFEPRLPP